MKLVICTDDFQNISWILEQRTWNWGHNWVHVHICCNITKLLCMSSSKILWNISV